MFTDILNPYQSKKLDILIKHFTHVAEKHAIEYVIDGGTLVGSMLHHNRIPWDDFDVYIKIEDRAKAVRVLQNTDFVVTSNGYYSKLWSRKFERVKNHHSWNWPFIDIGWLKQNETHIWEERSKEKRYTRNVYPKDWIFPPVLRPFGMHTLYAPRQSNAFLNYRFGPQWSTMCVVNHWNHILERWRFDASSRESTSILCNKIDVFIVQRTSYMNGTSFEWLVSSKDKKRRGPILIFTNESLLQT